MKRILAVLLLVMLLVAAVPATSLAAGAVRNGDSKMYHVDTPKGGNLNLRAKPNGKILTSLPNGTALFYKGKSGKWLKVRTPNGMTGYVYKPDTDVYAMANVNTKESGLNVRAKPNASSKILTSIPHGTNNVVVYAMNGNWAKVKWNGKTGYASKAYLKWTLYKD